MRRCVMRPILPRRPWPTGVTRILPRAAPTPAGGTPRARRRARSDGRSAARTSPEARSPASSSRSARWFGCQKKVPIRVPVSLPTSGPSSAIAAKELIRRAISTYRPPGARGRRSASTDRVSAMSRTTSNRRVAPREVLPGVVDHLVRAQVPEEVELVAVIDGRDLGPAQLRDLHRERPHAAARPVDQHPLAPAGSARRRAGTAARATRSAVRWRRRRTTRRRAAATGPTPGRTPGPRAHRARCRTGRPRRGRPRRRPVTSGPTCLDRPGDVDPDPAVRRPEHAGGDAGGAGAAQQVIEVGHVQRGRPDPDHHLARTRNRRLDRGDPQDVDRTVRRPGRRPSSRHRRRRPEQRCSTRKSVTPKRRATRRSAADR